MGLRLAIRASSGTDIVYRAEPLNDAGQGARPVDPVLIGNDLEPTQGVSQQLPLAKKMVRIPWTIEALIATRESLVNENPAGLQGIQQAWEQGAEEVIDHHDASEPLVIEGPSLSILQIGTDNFDIRPWIEIGDRLDVPIDTNRCVSA